MATIGVLTISDGRPFVHGELTGFLTDAENGLVAALEAGGHEVLRGSEFVASNDVATREARALAARRPDLTVLNIPVWAFPHFTMLAARLTPGPLLLFSQLNPQEPGLVGMLAAGGALDQVGRKHGRVFGPPDDPAVRAQLDRNARAAFAVNRLQGSTFGRIGGRPMGMYTAVSDGDQWWRQFGVDVEEIDQLELVRRADAVDPGKAAAARGWLEERCASVQYDGKQLTPELLERQIRSYSAMRELIEEGHLDFTGIKGQPELTTHFATMDVTEAFLNDPYDWDGPKAPHVCSTEADMDAALTMQILQGLTGTPVLFADVRHYHAEPDVWDLCNSGQHATWFAARSDDPAENLASVDLMPEDFFFPAGGASVRFVAAAGEMTFARLTRLDGRYRMQVLRGSLERLGEAVESDLMRQSTWHWPHAFARLRADAASILSRYGSNHIHAIPGDHVEELHVVCRLLDVDFDGIGDLT